jgi:plastocyanin
MRFLLPLLLVFVASSPRAGTPGGTITGRLKPQKDKKIEPNTVYVYARDVGRKQSKKLPGDGTTASVKQQGHAFVPHVLVVPLGTTVAFPNFAKEEHNVFSPSEPGFDLGRYNHDEKGKTRQFKVDDKDRRGYQIYCDIHREMSAWIRAVDSTWIAPVQPDGTYTITGVPAGTYQVAAWMPNGVDVVSAKITVKDDETTTVTEVLHPDALPIPDHTRKDGSAYTVYP